MSTKKPIDEKISNIPPFGLRMLPELKERISEAADASGRSMNAEIVARLESSFEKPNSPLSDLVKDFAQRLEREPGVTPDDVSGLWEIYNQCREAEWENVKTFMNAVGGIIQRASGKRSHSGQMDFITEQRRTDSNDAG